MDENTPIPTAGGRDLLDWILRRRRRLRVSGPSMEPLLFEGDVVFVDTSAYLDAPPRDLDVVVAQHPSTPTIDIVKRVEFSTDEGVYLRSDNPDAEGVSDSRQFGVVPFDLVIGKVAAVSPAKTSTTLQR